MLAWMALYTCRAESPDPYLPASELLIMRRCWDELPQSGHSTDVLGLRILIILWQTSRRKVSFEGREVVHSTDARSMPMGDQIGVAHKG